MEALHGLEVLAIDVGLAKPDFVAGAHRDRDVLRVDRRGQPVIRIVGEGDRLVNIRHLHDWGDGAEDLAADDLHVVAAARHHGGFIVVAVSLPVGAFPAGADLGTPRRLLPRPATPLFQSPDD